MSAEATSAVSDGRASLLDIVEELKLGLMQHATGGSMDATRYAAIRKTLLGAPNLSTRIPQFLRVCRDTGDFWSFIKQKFPTYQQRRDYLSAELNPLIDHLEHLSGASEQQFELGEIIGQGGFGVVHRVRHRHLDIDFAVKMLAPAFDDGSQVHADRFFREARVLFALNHPYIIRVYDVGLHGARPFIRMEYFEGKNLNSFLQAHGPLPPPKAAVLIRKILEGLAHAHEEARVVHRDLKPSNVMLAPGEKVRIVDFGLGVFIEQDLISRITKSGEAAVGGYYTAPELQAQPGPVDPRSDLYSVSALWFTALTGRPPAGVEIEEQLRVVPAMTSDYVKAVLQGLRRVEDRYQTALEMLNALLCIAK